MTLLKGKEQPLSSTDPRHSRDHWLAVLYDKLGGGLYRHAMVILADRSLAEDAVHQAFMRLLTRGRSDELASTRAFLITLVRNEAYRLLARRPLQDARERPPILESANAAETDEQRQEIEAALQKLPPEQREVIHLKLWQKLTFAEIGELLKIPQNTAASRYRYAIERLRELMPAAKE